MSLDKVLYTARATATGGRDGGAATDDNRLTRQAVRAEGPGR